MVNTANDDFWIEVWDRETHLETICRSLDAVVSQAAGHARIRRRPDMLLIHDNSRHVMEKFITSGELKVPPPPVIDGSIYGGLDVSPGDLARMAQTASLAQKIAHTMRR
jgi:hypothetical protein